MKKILFPCLLVFFGFGVLAQPSNDNKTNAIIISNTTSFVSGDAAYTNTGATADGPSNSCGIPQRDVWFKFQASTSEIEIKVLTGGTKGTAIFAALTLFDATGNQIACDFIYGAATFLQVANLTAGSWYYFSVDNYTGAPGTFALA